MSAFNKRFVIDSTTGGHAKGLPPAEAYLYIFEGVSIKPGRKLSPKEVLGQPARFTE